MAATQWTSIRDLVKQYVGRDLMDNFPEVELYTVDATVSRIWRPCESLLRALTAYADPRTYEQY